MRRRPPQALAPPLRGGPYLNFNGCCGLSPHRTALAPVDGTPHGFQRFAVDFIRIDDQGRAAVGDLTRNESFFTFGEPVYAVADGRVVRTRNELPDIPPLNEPPGSRFTTETTLGNNIGLKLRGGRYALYAHLKRGSIRVRAGQHVRRGQMLGRVGNSGQTGGSHLHFQLNDGASPVASDSPPFLLRQFTLLGMVTTWRSSSPAPPAPTCGGCAHRRRGAANSRSTPRSCASPLTRFVNGCSLGGAHRCAPRPHGAAHLLRTTGSRARRTRRPPRAGRPPASRSRPDCGPQPPTRGRCR